MSLVEFNHKVQRQGWFICIATFNNGVIQTDIKQKKSLRQDIKKHKVIKRYKDGILISKMKRRIKRSKNVIKQIKLQGKN